MIMKNIKVLLPLFIIFVITITGCFKDDVDIDVEKLTELGPIEFTAPLVNVSIKAEELLERLSDSVKNNIHIEDDGLITIKYKDSTITVWDEIVELEEVNYTFDYPVSSLLKSTNTDFNAEERLLINTSADQRLDTMLIQSSMLTLNLNFPTDGFVGDLVVTFPELTMNNTALSFTYDISQTAEPKTQDLTGYRLQFSHNANLDSSYFTMAITGSINLEAGYSPTGTEEITAQLTLSNLVPEVVYGFFGQDTVLNKDVSFNFYLYEELGVEGMIEFYDFQLKVEFDNYFGLPYNGILEKAVLSNSNTEESININFLENNTIFVEPATYSNSVIPTFNSFDINRSNSNIIDAINMYPNRVDYKVIVETNPNDINAINFVTQKNQLAGNIYTMIPMWLRTAAYTRSDTIQNFNTFKDLSDDDIQYLESITLALWFNNYFPFELDAQLYFVDENYTVVDSVFQDGKEFLATGELSDQDIVVSAGETLKLIEISKENVEYYKAQNVSHIIFSSHTSTANDGADFVKLLDSYGIDFKIAVEIKGELIVE